MNKTLIPSLSTLAGLIIFLLSLPVAVNAQRPAEDVLYLKNGSVLRGKLAGKDADSAVRLEMADGTVWRYRRTEYDSLRREKIPYRRLGLLSWRGYYNVTELGTGLVKTVDGTEYNFYFTMAQGYRFSPFMAAGVSAGLKTYPDQLLVPVMLDLRGDILLRQTTPFWYAQGGYSFNLAEHESQQEKGGVGFQMGLGIKAMTGKGSALVLSMGYDWQKGEVERFIWGAPTEDKITYRRIVLKLGLAF